MGIQSLAGAVGFTAMTYFLPIFFGWMMLERPSNIALVLQTISFAICVFIMFVGIVNEFQYVLDSAGGFTTDVPCKITEDGFNGTGCEAAIIGYDYYDYDDYM